MALTPYLKNWGLSVALTGVILVGSIAPSWALDVPPSPKQIEGTLAAVEDIAGWVNHTMTDPEAMKSMQDQMVAAQAPLMAAGAADAAMNRALGMLKRAMPPHLQMAMEVVQSLGAMTGMMPSFSKMAQKSMMATLSKNGVVAGALHGKEILTSRGLNDSNMSTTLPYILAGYWQLSGGKTTPDLQSQARFGAPQSPQDMLVKSLENAYKAEGKEIPSPAELQAQADQLLPQAVQDATTYRKQIEHMRDSMDQMSQSFRTMNENARNMAPPSAAALLPGRATMMGTRVIGSFLPF